MLFKSINGWKYKYLVKSEDDILLSHEYSHNEECVMEGDGTNLSHVETQLVIEMNIVELTTGYNQKDDEGQPLEAVVKQERNVEDNDQHCDERCQREIELLEYLLKEPESGSEITFSNKKYSQVQDSKGVSQILVGTKTCSSFQTNDVFAGIEEGGNDKHDAMIKEINGKLFLKGEIEIQEQQMNIEEGYVFKDIKDEEVAQSRQRLKSNYEEEEHKRDVMQCDIAKIIEDRIDGSKEDNNRTVVVQQRERHLDVSIIFWKMYDQEEGRKIFITLV